MQLIKDKWTKKDIKEFNDYLKSIKNKEKVIWTKRLLNTNMQVLAIKTSDIRKISAEISKGNFLTFLNFMTFDYYDAAAVTGVLITRIKDFDTMKKYLDIYSQKVDNWALCDLLSFRVNDKEELYYNLTKEYIKSTKPFVRRIGMSILFNFIDNEKYVNKIFEVLDTFKKEEDYYVNMMNAWLICECFIKQRNKTLKYIKNNNLNTFTINKAIKKCRESRRITKEDKELLLKYKIKSKQ